MTWQESVSAAIQRLTSRTGNKVFSRQELIESELAQIVSEVEATGDTPENTLSRVLQELRDNRILDFESPGIYRLLPTNRKELTMAHKTLFSIPVSEISPNPHNPRLYWDDADLDELEGSMKKVGILVPLTVYENTKSYPKTKFVLLDGERRWRCAKRLGWTTIKANVIDEPEDLTQNILFMFNIHHYRQEWELFPTALKLEQLFKVMGTDQESTIFKHTGVSRQMIRRCKMLLWFPHKYRGFLMERGGKISTDFFIEVYPLVRRLSKEEEYQQSEGIEKITDGLIKKFLARKSVTDVKDFRAIRKAMAFYEGRQNFSEFKKRLQQFVENENADMNLFTAGVEEEQNLAALTKYIACVLSILENDNPNAFTDAYVVELLKRLLEKIKYVLEEIE
jgi:ParB family chromosome partitioning protein